MCAKRLFDGPLCCTSTEPEPHTHRYEAAPADEHDNYDPEADR